MAGSGSATFSLAQSTILPPGHLVEYFHLPGPEESPNPIPGLLTDLPVHPGGFLGRIPERFTSRLQDLANLDFLVRVQIQSLIQVLEKPRPIAAGLSRLPYRRPPIGSASGMEVARPDHDIAQGAPDEAAREKYEDDPEDGLSSIRQ